MADQKLFGMDGKQADQLDAIREIVLGPPLRDLDRRLQKLARSIERLSEQQEQWRAEYETKLAQVQARADARLDRMARRLLRHRKQLQRMLAAIEAEWQRVQGRVKRERSSRLKLAELLTRLAQQVRTGRAPANGKKNSRPAATRPRRPTTSRRQKIPSAKSRERKSP
ncbi:hypothetical protein HUU39_13065 [candidate division KSB1 bacterium]|nr:hypothetical protein [bacterium]NUM66192.1 hypothetical protein [candidate division KSB1 bacterium]